MRFFLLLIAPALFAQNIVMPGPGNFHITNPAGVPVSDLFNEGSLNTSIWTLVANGGTQSMTGTQLQMNVPAASNHDPANGGVDNTVRVTQSMGNVDFIATSRFDSIPSLQYQSEGFSIKQDPNSNFVRLDISSNGTALTCDAWTIVAGTQTGINSTAVTGVAGSVWLQVQRSGNTWTELYSTDGTTFTNCATFSQTFTIDEFDIWGGNFNAPATNAPAFSLLANDFTGAGNGGGGGGGGAKVCPGSSATRVSQGHLNAVTGGCYENLHISTTSGDCVTMTNVSNATFHNNEIGPCDSSDTGGGSNSGMAFNINGGSGNRILDNYIHNETPCVVNRTCTNKIHDWGNNITVTNSPNLLVQGNVMVYGEDGVESLGGSHDLSVVGNFILNPINNTSVGQRGGFVQQLNTGYNTTIDHNYLLSIVSTTNGISPTYPTYSGDLINFGQDPSGGFGQDDNINVTNNYIQGGNFQFGCGLNFDGGSSPSSTGRLNTISGNLVVDGSTCGISIEGGYNYAISNNKVLNRTLYNQPNGASSAPFGNNGFQAFQCYNFQNGMELSACTGSIDLPCGNITYSNNRGYGLSSSNVIGGISITGGVNACTNVVNGTNGAGGNIFDSGTGPCAGSGSCAAFNSMQPPATQLPVPVIPPVPFGCVVASPYTNNTAVVGC